MPLKIIIIRNINMQVVPGTVSTVMFYIIDKLEMQKEKSLGCLLNTFAHANVFLKDEKASLKNKSL